LHTGIAKEGIVGAAHYYYCLACHNSPPPAKLNTVSKIYKALLPTPIVQPIMGLQIADNIGKTRWKWISVMPINDNTWELRWCLWHSKLLIKLDDFFSPAPCCWCGSPTSGRHILNSCKTAKKLIQSVRAKFKHILSNTIPSNKMWELDWVSDNVLSNPQAMAIDTIMTAVKWALWKGYCFHEYGQKPTTLNNMLTEFTLKLSNTVSSIQSALQQNKPSILGSSIAPYTVPLLQYIGAIFSYTLTIPKK
jgi:hypothetical protein